MNTKAATDLPGQDQQSDEEDEEIHRAHRLQVLQHSGSAQRAEISGCRPSTQMQPENSQCNAKIKTLALFQCTVIGQSFPFSALGYLWR